MTLAHVIVSNARPHASTAATAMPPIMPTGGGVTQSGRRALKYAAADGDGNALAIKRHITISSFTHAANRDVGRSTKKVHNRGGHRSTAGFP